MQEISIRTKQMLEFWSNPHGWAHEDAYEILSKSRLDRQMALTETLNIWISANKTGSEGELILAWVNLGSLVEGALKLFLCIYYDDYMKSVYKMKNWGKEIDPDSAMMEGLRKFYSAEGILDTNWIQWIERIQSLRNSIHAYKDREIETFDSFYKELETYLEFLIHLASRVPYPY